MTASTPVLNQHGLTEHSHVGGASVRTRGVDSHLHGVGSTDPEAHPLPSAKSEVWRFTPLRRMRGLDHDRVFDGIVGADNDRTVEGPTVGPDAITVRRVTGDEAAALKGISGNLPTIDITFSGIRPGENLTQVRLLGLAVFLLHAVEHPLHVGLGHAR